MENSINIKCISATYLCSAQPNSNFHKDDSLFVGTVKNSTSQSYSLFKSLLQFPLSDFNVNSFKNIYLYLFLENVHNVNKNSNISISISGIHENLNISNLNWQKCPKKNSKALINSNITTQPIKRYIKIDITSIIKLLDPKDEVLNLLIEPLNTNSSSLIQLDSVISKNLPYLLLETNKDLSDNIDSDKITNYDTKDEDENIHNDFSIADFSTEVINELSSQSSRFDGLEESLSNLVNSFDSVLTNINNNSTSINNKMTPTITKLTEDFASLSSNILELQSFTQGSISNLDNAVKLINENISNLSVEVKRLAEAISDIVIMPLDDKSL